MIRFPCPQTPAQTSVQKNWLMMPGLALSGLAVLLWFVLDYQAGFLTLNQLGRWLPGGFWTHITLLGDARVAVAIALPFALHSPQLAWRIMLALILGGVLTHVMKAGFAMPRPPAVLQQEQFNLLGAALKKGSFPSGHSLTAFAAAGMAVAWSPRARWRIVLLLLATLAALSRTMVGVHWPVDVLAGSGLGLLVAWAAMRLGAVFPAGSRPGVHVVWLLLMSATTLSLVGYDGQFPQNRLAGHVLAVLIILAAIWSWFSCRGPEVHD